MNSGSQVQALSLSLFIPFMYAAKPCLAAHQGVEAATEFQKILDHRGVTVNDQWAAWRICSWAALTPCRAILRKPKWHTRIF